MLHVLILNVCNRKVDDIKNKKLMCQKYIKNTSKVGVQKDNINNYRESSTKNKKKFSYNIFHHFLNVTDNENIATIIFGSELAAALIS